MSDKTMTATAVISAKDATGNVFGQVASKMRKLDQQARAVGKNMAPAAMAPQTNAANMLSASLMIGMPSRFIAPAAMAVAAKKSVDNFNSLETSMTKLGVTAEASDDQVQKAMQAFRRQGPPLGVTAKEMAEAANQFVAAGLSFDESVKAVQPAVKAAKASGGEVKDLSDAGISAMQQFGFQANNLERAFEIMAKAGKLGRVELKDMAKLMPTVGVGAKRL